VTHPRAHRKRYMPANHPPQTPPLPHAAHAHRSAHDGKPPHPTLQTTHNPPHNPQLHNTPTAHPRPPTHAWAAQGSRATHPRACPCSCTRVARTPPRASQTPGSCGLGRTQTPCEHCCACCWTVDYRPPPTCPAPHLQTAVRGQSIGRCTGRARSAAVAPHAPSTQSYRALSSHSVRPCTPVRLLECMRMQWSDADKWQ
jgi:hypothetical protein